ncbi:MAG: zinc ABC transporter substrate-binding protein [Chloroflexales bacterium]|nr:zinc ABC transporter substrate-binding protein [Chloroflexales bacterium]
MLLKAMLPLVVAAALMLGACGQTPAAQSPAPAGPAAQAASQPIKVVASTSIIGDVVSQIGGDRVAVSTLVPIGGDAHSFAPSPQDIARVTEAQVVFVSGAGYEEFLTSLLESAGGQAELVELSKGITLRALAEGEAHADEHGGRDPHTWTDPANVKYWTAAIAETLGRLDSANARLYQENATRYNVQLDDLGAWIGEQFAQVPEERRLLVTDHAVFGYMADRYGLKQVGTLLPGYSSSAEASAQDLAALQEKIKDLGVRVIFVGSVVNENLARQIANDTGTQLVTVLTESLTPAGGVGPTYIEYMRHNVTAMAEALR